VASINFVTCHDGFTLTDLVSYNEKHNEANGEDNRDGENYNRSWNCGVEGETDDPKILELRARQRRNLIATLLLSQGVPMLSHGDEIGRTQRGNNNAYCQDNELTWVDWEQADKQMLAFTRWLIEFRRRHPIFWRRRFFTGKPMDSSDGGPPLPDISWFAPNGRLMGRDDWEADFGQAVGIFLNGDGNPSRDAHGERILDESFLIFFNAGVRSIDFVIPSLKYGGKWQLSLDTSRSDWETVAEGEPQIVEAGERITVQSKSLMLLMRMV